jgi:hypothetical protein
MPRILLAGDARCCRLDVMGGRLGGADGVVPYAVGWPVRRGYFSNLGVSRVHMRSSWASGMLVTGMDALAVSSSMT